MIHTLTAPAQWQQVDLLSDLHDAYEGDELEQKIETLCNVAAAAILIPQHLLSEMCEKYGYTGETLARLARRGAERGLLELLKVPYVAKVELFGATGRMRQLVA